MQNPDRKVGVFVWDALIVDSRFDFSRPGQTLYTAPMTDPVIRRTVAADLPTITRIYDHAVRTGTATFELEPPDLAEMTRRFEALMDGGFPYLVAARGGEVLGYAYAGPYRPRPAYRFTVENSIYLDNAATSFPKPECVYEAMDRYHRESGVAVGVGRIARQSKCRPRLTAVVSGWLNC